MAFVRYFVGDVVKMKKAHPCGSDEWEVKRIGTDFLIHCKGCGHQLLISRPKFEKAVKKLYIAYLKVKTNITIIRREAW